jgi:RNA polymerase sigma-70 factor (ECF subfamily)
VLSARQWPAPESTAALASLYEIYWYPLYAFIRGRGHLPAEAQDLTQDFFVHLLEKETLQRARQEGGRFRAFLLAALGYFLQNERDRARAQKRGGDRALVSLDMLDAEERYRAEPTDPGAPAQSFDRRWANEIVASVLARLKREYAASEKAALFEALEKHLTSAPAHGAFAEIAGQLGMTEGAAKVALHRLRRRFGELLRTEVAQTLADPADAGDELRHLCAVLAE